MPSAMLGFLAGVGIIAAAHAASPCTAITVKGERELWINDQRIIGDDRGVNTPRWSPDGERLAYANDFDPASDPVSHIIVIDRAGHVMQTVPIPESARFNFIDEMGWLNPSTIWVEGHVNPSVAIYDEFDLATSEMKHETYGTHFAPSPNGAILAYRGNEPHPARSNYHPPLMLDDRAIALPDGVAVSGPIAWAPTGERLAVSIQKDGRAGVAFLTAGGMLERVVVLPAKGRNQALLWSDDNTVLVRPTIQPATYRVARDGKVEEATKALPLQHDEACRPDLAGQ